MRGLVLCVLASGCWQSEPLIDQTFTSEQWSFLQTMQLPEPDLCPPDLGGADCINAAELGHRLFFEPKLSGAILINDPFAPGLKDQEEKVACVSCHASTPELAPPPGQPVTPLFFVDTRSQPNNVSSGAIYTGHNAMSLVNIGFKAKIAAQTCGTGSPDYCLAVYSWNGRYSSPGRVLELAGLKAMNSTQDRMAQVVRENPTYAMLYQAAFHGFASDHNMCLPMQLPCHDTVTVFNNLALAFDAYTRRLISLDAPFDRYIAGSVGEDGVTSSHDVFTDAQRRGLEVFIGKGMCVECHRGPLLSDLDFHVTGVEQSGLHAPKADRGLAAFFDQPDNLGKFLTPPLRHVAETAPYMHAGQLPSLAAVIDHYRHGGDTEGFQGVKDPRIQPLEIDDDEARDLEAFLRTLTGAPVALDLATKPVP